MAGWFHCNRCYLEIRNAHGAKFNLTTCGHIYCEKCLNSGKSNSCQICNNECTTIVLASNLSPDVQTFFSDLSEPLQKLIKVHEFQKNNYKKLIDHKTKQNELLEQKYQHAKDYIKKLTKNYESLSKDHQRLRNLLKMSIGTSPAPGTCSRRTLDDSGSVVDTPTAPIPISGHNSSRSIVRGPPGYSASNMKNGPGNRRINQQNFRTPIYPNTPSLASVASSGGSRTSMPQGRPNGIPPYMGPSPSSLNLSGLNFCR